MNRAIDDLRNEFVRLYLSGTTVGGHVKRFLRLVDRELHTGQSIPITQRIAAYRHGFVSTSVPLYGLDEHEHGRFLSQWQSEKARAINGDAAVVHDNKHLFYYVLQPEFSHRLPELFGTIQDGEFTRSPLLSRPFETLLDILDVFDCVIVKPTCGTHGGSVSVLERGEAGYLLDGNHVDEDRLPFGDGSYVVTAFAEQADYSATIHPGSANTLRIMTMIDPDTGDPFVGAADHRFGTSQSSPVDNSAQGGLSTGIDLETGRLQTAVTRTNNETVVRHTRHPETDTRLFGTQIPCWDQICAGVLEMAAFLAPLTPYIGWDVLVTDDDGSFKILEANSAPDVPLQAHEPLLADDRVRRFYEYHDVL